jgi:hypothetical protein
VLVGAGVELAVGTAMGHRDVPGFAVEALVVKDEHWVPGAALGFVDVMA